jgi:Trk K+ transport system NAD-binding subunit
VNDTLLPVRPNWRWFAALALFAFAFGPFVAGVSVTNQPDELASGLLAKLYFALSLFVFGGLDIGLPAGGPPLARGLLWVAYVGAPLLTASAVIEAIVRVVAPHSWQLRRLSRHIVVAGQGELVESFLRTVARSAPIVRVVVVMGPDATRAAEFVARFGATIVHGTLSHRYLLRRLRLGRATRVVLLGDDDFESYEIAGRILRMHPQLAGRIVLHSHNLRFMRAMATTAVGRQCHTFNGYHLAAASLVRERLITHFARTAARDVVVLAGFGRFGQTILEELQDRARGHVQAVAIIDLDADRRMLVVEEQARLDDDYQRVVVQGDVSNPKVWHELATQVDLGVDQPTVVLGTGNAAENLRSALWIKGRYPNAFVFARTNDVSEFALEVGAEHGVNAFSIRQLVEDNLPAEWSRGDA